ncbi:MAG TPA: 4-hydroxy-tetrahydrodipicolinate reductase [Candidatus Acidoferrum sp.]|nr:4-hydroxy-tetrahydrodipicolinate reductase [Candidatus Acidoferrum sp.]
MLRIAIAGATGRMGKTLIETITRNPALKLGAASVLPEDPALGKDIGTACGLGALGVIAVTDLATVKNDFDAVIDFTAPAATMAHLDLCAANGKMLVIGTTGLSDEQKQRVAKAGERTRIVFAPSMSVGVNLCYKLLELAARVIGEEADIEIIEAHHRHKVDAPSGTALKMGEVIANTLGRNLKDCAVYGREGITGARGRKTIGFSTIRAGEIVGDHTVMFATAGERIEITHKSASRQHFADGAVRAVLWLQGKQNGVYSMMDVLGL